MKMNKFRFLLAILCICTITLEASNRVSFSNISELESGNLKIVFNLDKVNMTKDVYVTEGPIDSFFINNSVAVGSADLKKLERIIDKSKLVLVFDNQPRNKEVVKIIAKAIDDQYKVVLWPDNISQKDINEMISQGVNDVQSLINNNTFQGLRAQAAFTNWRKIK